MGIAALRGCRRSKGSGPLGAAAAAARLMCRPRARRTLVWTELDSVGSAPRYSRSALCRPHLLFDHLVLQRDDAALWIDLVLRQLERHAPKPPGGLSGMPPPSMIGTIATDIESTSPRPVRLRNSSPPPNSQMSLPGAAFSAAMAPAPASSFHDRYGGVVRGLQRAREDERLHVPR